MPRIRTMIAALFALIPFALVFVPNAARAEKRIALVIGNAGYQAGALNTPANDAGLIAQTLQAAGFDAVGARDLDQDSLRRAFRDFLEKATSSGPDTVAFIYVSGYGLQLEGENYIIPIDAKIARDSDVAAEALRISDYTRPLAALKLKAGIVVLDAARANSLARSGPPLAGGLALVEPEPRLLVAFNAAPGTVAPEGQGPYGAYAQALAEMIREGGLPLDAVFERARLRVNDVTKGAQVPWHASKVETSLVFFERGADAPPPVASTEQAATMRSRPLGGLGAPEAYIAALDRDTVEGYGEFLAAYPDDPMAKRVRAMVAARREALTWRRTRAVDTPPAYWSYLRRYPQGPHAPDAHRRLAFLAAALEPPPSFTVLAYDLPPPPPEEMVYIRRPILVFDDPIFAFAPPPPLVIFLAPPPPDFVVLPPPAPPVGIFLLPVPVYRPVPVWVRPPVYVAPPPPNNVIYRNVHNTVVINNVTNTVTITNPSGQTRTMAPPAAQVAAQPQGAPGGRPAAPAALGPALPPSVAQKAAILRSQNPQGPGAPAATTPASTTPSATVAPGTPTSTATSGGAKPGTAAPRAPAATAPASTTPSAAVTPGTPTSTATSGGAKPGTAAPRAPAATAPASTTPSAGVTPGTPTPTPGAKPGTRPAQTPPGTVPPPTTPSAAVTPGTPTPTHGGSPKRGPPPSQMPSTPSAATTPVTTQSPTPAPGGNAKLPPPPPHVPAARQATPQRPAAAIKPIAPSPPAGSATPVAPQPPPPAAKLMTPPLSSPPSAKPITPAPAPAAAAARPAPSPSAPTPKVVQPQAKGCPPGKTMAVVNGQQVCK